VPISVTCSACGQNFNLRDELAGRTVRCRCGKPLPVPGAAAKDSLIELLDDELSRPYEPPPEREAPKYIPERRRRRAGPRHRKPQIVVSEPTATQVLLWVTGGLTGWLLSLAAIPTAMYLSLRALLADAPADATVAGVVLVAMFSFNGGALGLLLRAPRYVTWARWSGGFAAISLVAAGIAVQIIAESSEAPASAAGVEGPQLTSLFGNLAMAVMYAIIPAFVAVAASIGPKVRPS
jgi:hypothetical protein